MKLASSLVALLTSLPSGSGYACAPAVYGKIGSSQ